MYWENDLGQAGGAEIPRATAAEIFEGMYGFRVEHLPIPLQDPVEGVQRELRNYQVWTASSDCLVILYYVGHGALLTDREYYMSSNR